ncbi:MULTISPECIES: phosphosulfolactate synthase [unclassified Nocardioides]|jgi:phosphosulfolactate synthase|uniref:phosphosulfolactate synthase n=1 Tax=unclassified Nocardioides TaxID=2615069 RepID=UPI0000570AC6|nr:MULTISPECIES: phosphosulfolactate synthase [unclassified Nocardioides]ABL79400.1 phosphosulfolactate synthase [Nocardioides sp. JS614]
MHEKPDFLDLPTRDTKPRISGLTHVLDKGMPLRSLDALLEQAADLIDVLKVGWGIAYIDPQIAERAHLCRQAGVTLCLGGTLLEVSAANGRIPELARWAHRVGIGAVEVSNGLERMSCDEKRILVRDLSGEFVVLAETGAKDGHTPVTAHLWVDEMEADLAAGATLVIAEGRESGTVGLYHPDGTPRVDLAEAIAERISLDRVIFEAPAKSHQTWFVSRFGPHVGLGNIGSDEVIALETLRLGLRADTALLAGPARIGVPS